MAVRCPTPSWPHFSFSGLLRDKIFYIPMCIKNANMIMSDITYSITKFSELNNVDKDNWNEIKRSNTDFSSAFCSYEFCEAVDKVYGSVMIAKICVNLQCVGYFPFQYKNKLNKILGRANKLGEIMADYFSLIFKNDVSLNFRSLMQCAKINSMSYDHLPSFVSRSVDLNDYNVSFGLKIEIPDDGNYMQLLKEYNKEFHKKVTKRIRQLEVDFGELKFTFDESSTQMLTNVIDAKIDQYDISGKSNIFSNASRSGLLHQLHKTRSENCSGILSTLYAGDTWVASHFGLKSSNTLHFWFPVYNKQVLKYGPGHILRFFMIDNAKSNNIAFFDFGEGENMHKKEYLANYYELHKGFIFQASVLGYLSKIFQSISWRFYDLVKGANFFKKRTNR